MSFEEIQLSPETILNELEIKLAKARQSLESAEINLARSPTITSSSRIVSRVRGEVNQLENQTRILNIEIKNRESNDVIDKLDNALIPDNETIQETKQENSLLIPGLIVAAVVLL